MNSMIMMHIRSKKTPEHEGVWFYTLCGRTRFEPNKTFIIGDESVPLATTFRDPSLEPTCEACILLHFANPENTDIDG